MLKISRILGFLKNRSRVFGGQKIYCFFTLYFFRKCKTMAVNGFPFCAILFEGWLHFRKMWGLTFTLHSSVRNGQVSYQCRYLRTNSFKNNLSSGRIVSTEFGTNPNSTELTNNSKTSLANRMSKLAAGVRRIRKKLSTRLTIFPTKPVVA